MLLIALSFVLLAVSSAGLAAVPSLPRRLQGVLAELSLILGVLGLLWVTSLLLPAPANWLGAGAGVLGFAYARAAHGKRENVAPLVLGLALTAITFHFMLALLDVTMSTREFSTDGALLQAAVVHGLSAASLTLAAPFAFSILAGASVGHWLAVRSRRVRARA